MPTIDWDRIEGQSVRATPTDQSFECTPEEVQAAIDAIEAMPAIDPTDPDLVATLWPVEDKFGIDALDFGDETLEDLDIAGLYACTADLSREKLIWHVQNPGKSKKPGPFTEHPIVLQSKKKQTIVDGEHRLAALLLLGATTWPCTLVPK